MILESFLQRDLTRFHADSFVTLLEYQLPQIIASYGKVTTMMNAKKYSMDITDVKYRRCDLTPEAAIELNTTYQVAILATVRLYCEAELVSSARFPIVKLPICTGVFGDTDLRTGIFIVHGKQRTLPPVKGMHFNTPLLSTKHGLKKLQLRSAHARKPFRSTSTLDLSINKAPRRGIGFVECHLPFQASSTNVGTVAMALGCTPPEFNALVASYAGTDYHPGRYRQYEISILCGRDAVHTEDEALRLITKSFGKTGTSIAINVLRGEVFPHLNRQDDTYDPVTKVHYLAWITSLLIAYRHDNVEALPRDALANVSTMTSANFIGQLFRLQFIAHVRTAGKLLRRALLQIQKKGSGIIDIAKLYGEIRLTTRVVSAVASGSWTVQKKGVTVSLNSNNDDGIEAQLRRVSSSLATTDGTHTTPRCVSHDQYGYVCAASTPDGQNVGLVSELAITASFSPDEPESATPQVVEEAASQILRPITELSPTSYLFISSDGSIVGCMATDDVHRMVALVRGLRRQRVISPYTFVSVHPSFRLVRLWHQSGLFIRPLIVANRKNDITPGMTFDTAWQHGIIEYIAPVEESTVCTVATTSLQTDPSITHVELCESSFLGLMANMVPFATSQQGPRLSYLTHQRKQFITATKKGAMGAIMTTQLSASHRPLVTTRVARVNERDELVGTPAVVAFLCMDENQEDAIIVNKASVERGLMAASTTRIYTSDAIKGSSVCSERFERPDVVLSKRTVSYEAIQPNGMPRRGAFIPGGAAVIGKTRSTHPGAKASIRRDISTTSRNDEAGLVDSVHQICMPSGTRTQVSITTDRPIEQGDKLTTGFSQKGIVSQLRSQEDMPFSERTGVAPDIVVSPLGQTSRMTMGSLIEALCGKAVAVAGDMALGIDDQQYSRDNTRFTAAAGKALQEAGFNSKGTEVYIDGTTGRRLKAQVFVGIVQYARLVHIASKKLHSRQTGPKDPLTRQPRDGRRSNGGLRVGELEASALVAHGAAAVLSERFMQLSDDFSVLVCGVCQQLAEGHSTEDLCFCRVCQATTAIMEVKLSFGSLLLLYELRSTGVNMKFVVDKL